VSSRTARAIQRNPVSEKQQQQKNKNKNKKKKKKATAPMACGLERSEVNLQS
jgi:hypothetical protein